MPSMDYQLVLKRPCSSLEDYDEMISIEDQLIGSLSSEHDVEGHDAGSGEMNIFHIDQGPGDGLRRGRVGAQQASCLSAGPGCLSRGRRQGVQTDPAEGSQRLRCSVERDSKVDSSFRKSSPTRLPDPYRAALPLLCKTKRDLPHFSFPEKQ